MQPTPPVLFSSRDLDLCMSWRSSDLIAEQSREHHHVNFFLHSCSSYRHICMHVFVGKQDSCDSIISVLLCVNVVLHAHVCLRDCVPCN